MGKNALSNIDEVFEWTFWCWRWTLFSFTSLFFLFFFFFIVMNIQCTKVDKLLKCVLHSIAVRTQNKLIPWNRTLTNMRERERAKNMIYCKWWNEKYILQYRCCSILYTINSFCAKKIYRTRENAIRKRDGPCQKLLKLYDFIILIR